MLSRGSFLKEEAMMKILLLTAALAAAAVGGARVTSFLAEKLATSVEVNVEKGAEHAP